MKLNEISIAAKVRTIS